jgi:DNA-binding CsgD family transcriptional regulator
MALDEPIRIALDLANAELRDRLAAVLGRLTEVELVGPDRAADAILSTGHAGAADLDLTPREEQVLLILAEGASNPEIATRLEISVHTAKFHVRRVMEKLDATGRLDAVAHAARLGVIRL